MKIRWMTWLALVSLTACGTDPVVNDPVDDPSTNNSTANNTSTADAGNPTADVSAAPDDGPGPMKPDAGPPPDLAPPSYGEWFENFGGTDAEIVEGVASDADGNVYVTGTFRETITVGTQMLTAVEPANALATDAFVASFDREGEFRWATSFGSDGSEKPFGVEVTPDGGVFVVGNSQGELTFDGSVLAHKGQGDLFAVKYDTEGNYQWAQSWGGQYTESVRDIAVNEQGDLFITGSWQGLFTAGDRTYSAETDWSAMEVLVLAIDGGSGAVKWSNSFNGFLMDTGTAISADSQGNVIVGVSFQYDLDIADVELTAGESWHGAIVKLDATGQVQWHQMYGKDGEVTEITGIELAEDGSVYATGVFSGTMNFGGEDLVNPLSGQDALILGLEADGSHRFSRSFGGEGFDQPLDLVARGSVFYITGRFDGEIAFGETTLVAAAEGYDIFVAGFGDSTGDVRWARGFGGPENDQANAVAVGPALGIYVAGYNDGGDFMFNEDMMPAASEWVDAVVFRLED